MKAFILAAGLGTRLKPLTGDKPKALVEVNGTSMLGNLILHLKTKGIRQFLVNLHHFSAQIIEHVEANGQFGVDIAFSDESEALLDTGGAIGKAAWFFKGNEPVLVHNVDILSTLNPDELRGYHRKQNSLVTLCVRKRKSTRALLFDRQMQLRGWANLSKKEFRWVGQPSPGANRFAFSGVYLAQPEFAEKLTMKGRFSIIDAWLSMAGTERVLGFEDKSDYWFDLGTEEKIKAAEDFLKDSENRKSS